MKLFTKAKDGGKYSPVDAYFLFEIKGFISIALLKFNKGTREAFHTHAFNAFTWFLCGDLEEERYHFDIDTIVSKKYSRKLVPKLTTKDNLHRVIAHTDSWCFTIRGPWSKYWTEWNNGITTVFTHRREVVDMVRSATNKPIQINFDTAETL